LARPKRRKHKDNPYVLDYCIEKNKFYIEYIDSRNESNKVDVSEEVYKVMDSFELDDISQMNEFDRHIEHLQLSENELHLRMSNKELSVEEAVNNKEMIDMMKTAIERLPEIQCRRIKMYYFEEMTFEEIAIIEGCTKRAVKFSVDIALKKLKEVLEN